MGIGIRIPEFSVNGDGQSLLRFPETPPGQTMPDYLAALLAPQGIKVSNVAHSAISYSGLLPDLTSRDGNAKIARTTLTILVGGFSDVWLENNAGTVVYADMGRYADAKRALGYTYVIGTTITPASDSVWFAQAQKDKWTDANVLILADANSKFDTVIDLAGTPGLDDPDDLTYYADGLHWTAAGAELAADTVYPIILDTLGLA